MQAPPSRPATRRPTGRFASALLSALLLAALPLAALPAGEAPAPSAVLSLWNDVVAWVENRVANAAGPPSETQSLEECGTPEECEAGVDIEPHG